MNEPVVHYCGICGNRFPMVRMGGTLTLDYMYPTSHKNVHRGESVEVCFICADLIEQFVTNIGHFAIRSLDAETRKALFPFHPVMIDGGARWVRHDEVEK